MLFSFKFMVRYSTIPPGQEWLFQCPQKVFGHLMYNLNDIFAILAITFNQLALTSILVDV